MCAELLYKAFVAPCGHSICTDCKDSLVETNSNPPCPECRAKVTKYAVNFAMRTMVESVFANETMARWKRTTEGRIRTLIDGNPGLVIHKRQHDGVFVLFLLEIAVECKTASEIRNRIAGAVVHDDHLCILVLARSDVASWCVRSARTTVIETPASLFVRVFGAVPNPLLPESQRKRPRSDAPSNE